MMIIAVDFDGTVVDHRYPDVGGDVPGAVAALRELVASGARIVLFTMRSGARGDGSDPLADAVKWYADRNIPLYGVNVNPDQHTWTASPKVCAHRYVDDAAVGVPLREYPRAGSRPCVDWEKVLPTLLADMEAKRA